MLIFKVIKIFKKIREKMKNRKNPKIASVSGPDKIVYFEKGEKVKIKFTVNLVNVHPKKKYNIFYSLKKDGRVMYENSITPFGEEVMDKTSSGYISILDIILNTDKLKSGQYEYQFALIEVKSMAPDGKSGAGIVQDSKNDIFVAEEKKI